MVYRPYCQAVYVAGYDFKTKSTFGVGGTGSLKSVLSVDNCERPLIWHNGVFLWNNLPVNIRQQVTLSSFKTKLKLYLFCMYCI